MPTVSRRPIPSQPTLSARKQHKLQARSLAQAEARSRRIRRGGVLAAVTLVLVIAAALIVHIATTPPADDALSLATSQPSGPAIAWSPDGSRVAEAASTGGTIGIWDATKGTLLHSIALHGGPIRALAWSGDGRYLAAGVAAAAGQQGAAQPVATSRGRVVGAPRRATSPATYLFHLWSAGSWTEQTGALRSLAGPVAVSLAFVPTGHRLAAQDSQGLILVDVPGIGQVSKLVNIFRQQNGYAVLSPSPDGRQIAVGEEDVSAGMSTDRVAILNAATLRTERLLSIQRGFPANLIGAAAWSPDGTRLAIGGLGGQIEIYDTRTGKTIRDLDRGLSAVNALGWSHDGVRLAAGGNNVLAIYDVRSGSVIQRRQAPGDLSGGNSAFNSVQGLAWSPDGRRLLIGSSNAHTRIWMPDAARP